MKKNCRYSIVKIFSCVCLLVATVFTASAESEKPSFKYQPSFKEVPAKADWANPDHYLSSEQIVDWSKSVKSSTTEAFPTEEPTSLVAEYKNDLLLRTNLAYWLVGVLNLGVEWRLTSTQFGILLNAGYGPFSKASWEFNTGGWYVAPEVRYYLGKRDQWFVGVMAMGGEYEVKLGANKPGREGYGYMAGVVGGYKIFLSDNFDMDFSLGLGYGWMTYEGYRSDANGNRAPIDGIVIKNDLVMPIQVGVNLIWKGIYNR